MAQQPAVAVGGVDDVHIAPDERARRRGQFCGRELAFCVRVVVVVALFARARERDASEQRSEKGEKEHSCTTRGSVRGSAIISIVRCYIYMYVGPGGYEE